MTWYRWSLVISFAALAGACDGSQVDVEDDRLAALIERVDALEAKNSALEQQLADAATQTWVETRIAAIAPGGITQAMLNTALEGYATESWVEGKGYLASSALAGYATETWVGEQSYLTSSALAGYATETWVAAQNYVTSSALAGYATEAWVAARGYLTSSALTGYATEAWVGARGYLASSALTGYATEAWVAGRNYLTSATLDSYATKTWVGEQSYLTSATLDDYATKTWVGEQSYLTSAGLSGYATETWVGEQGFLTSATLSGYATETWVEEADFVRLINEDMTLTVGAGQDHETLSDALSWLDDYRITTSASVTLALTGGTHTHTEPVEIAHPNGSQIRIVGSSNEATPTILAFEASSGLVIQHGHTLGWLEHVTIRGDGAEASDSLFGATGIFAWLGGTASLGSDVTVEDFSGDGVSAVLGGAISADRIEAHNNAVNGVSAVVAGSIIAQKVEVSGSEEGVSASAGGVLVAFESSAHGNEGGYYATLGATIVADKCSAVDNDFDGYVAEHGSVIECYESSDATGNGSNGYLARTGSVMNVPHAVAKDNGRDGFEAFGSSVLSAEQGRAESNDSNGVRAHGASFAWVPNIKALSNLGSGISVSGSSAIDANTVAWLTLENGDPDQTEVKSNESFGINHFWNGFINVTGVVVSDNTWDPDGNGPQLFNYNLTPTTNPTDESFAYREPSQ